MPSKHTIFRDIVTMLSVTGHKIIVTKEQFAKLPETKWFVKMNGNRTLVVQSKSKIDGHTRFLSTLLFGYTRTCLQRVHENGNYLDYRTGNVYWISRHTSMVKVQPPGGPKRLTQAEACSWEPPRKLSIDRRIAKEKAEVAAVEKNPDRKLRNCLKCDKSFHSLGPHNRLCPVCQFSNSRQADEESYRVAKH
jgi:hypothetical protein